MASEDKVNILVVDDMPDRHLATGLILESLGQNRFVKVPPTQIAIRPDAAPFLGKSSIQDSMITH